MFKIFRSFLDWIYVPKCGGCRNRMDKTEDGMCMQCKRLYLNEREEFCDFCGMAANICTCIPHNLMIKGCIDYRKLIFYRKTQGTAAIRNMIYRIKRNNDIALIDFFAKELFKIDNGILPENPIVTYAPRTANAVKEYGYDQGKLLAERYAKIGGFEHKTLLRRKWRFKQTQQKLVNFKQRAANISGAFAICEEKTVKGRNIILIDDVVTSGSTLGECVALLYASGARSVVCRSIACTYRKNKLKND